MLCRGNDLYNMNKEKEDLFSRHEREKLLFIQKTLHYICEYRRMFIPLHIKPYQLKLDKDVGKKDSFPNRSGGAEVDETDAKRPSVRPARFVLRAVHGRALPEGGDECCLQPTWSSLQSRKHQDSGAKGT